MFASGAATTLGLTAVSTALGIAVGVLGAAGSDSKHGWLRALVGGYVEAIRNTPFIVQLFFVFFGLPALGVHLERIHRGHSRDDAQPRRVFGRDHPRGRRRGAEGTSRSGGIACDVARADLPACRAAAGDREGLSRADEPDRHHDARLGGRLADLGARPHVCGELHPVAQLPRVRDVLPDHGGVSRDGDRVALAPRTQPASASSRAICEARDDRIHVRADPHESVARRALDHRAVDRVVRRGRRGRLRAARDARVEVARAAHARQRSTSRSSRARRS